MSSRAARRRVARVVHRYLSTRPTSRTATVAVLAERPPAPRRAMCVCIWSRPAPPRLLSRATPALLYEALTLCRRCCGGSSFHSAMPVEARRGDRVHARTESRTPQPTANGRSLRERKTRNQQRTSLGTMVGHKKNATAELMRRAVRGQRTYVSVKVLDILRHPIVVGKVDRRRLPKWL